MDEGCARLTAPPSVWALLTFALTTVLCLAFDSSLRCASSSPFLWSAIPGHKYCSQTHCLKRLMLINGS